MLKIRSVRNAGQFYHTNSGLSNAQKVNRRKLIMNGPEMGIDVNSREMELAEDTFLVLILYIVLGSEDTTKPHFFSTGVVFESVLWDSEGILVVLEEYNQESSAAEKAVKIF